MPSGDELGAALERLERAFTDALPTDAVRLRPPLTDGQLAHATQSIAPYRLPADVVELYQWHNGFDEWHDDRYLTLFMDASFPSVEQALADRSELMDYAADNDPEYWPGAWFPVAGSSASGEFVTLEPRSSPRSHVLWSYHSHDGDLTPRYDSVTSLIATTAHLWEQGLLPERDDDAERAHRRLAVVAEMNPLCFDDQTDWIHRRFESSRFLDESWLPEWTNAIGYVAPTDPLPSPTPISDIDWSRLTGEVVITGLMEGLAGGLDWQHVQISDGTGTINVRLTRADTKNYIARNQSTAPLFVVRPMNTAPSKTDTDDKTDSIASRVAARIAADVLAVEIRAVPTD